MFITPDDDTLLNPAVTDQLCTAAYKHNKMQELCDAMNAAEDRLMKRLTAPDALTKAAHWYATQGIPIFPCKPRAKQPATRHGFKDATTNLQQITQWWNTNPAYNIGLPTGHLVDVIDLDNYDAYSEAVEALNDSGIITLGEAVTPRGRHYYIQPTGEKTTTNIGGIPHLDYRGIGGYVIAPPSQTLQPDGTTLLYWWLTPLTITKRNTKEQ